MCDEGSLRVSCFERMHGDFLTIVVVMIDFVFILITITTVIKNYIFLVLKLTKYIQHDYLI